MWRLMLLCFLLIAADTPFAAAPPADVPRCFREAGIKFSVDWRLLQAIAEVESGLNPEAIGLNKKDGRVVSEDIGIMQINSTWLQVLNPMGITRDILLKNPCQNIHVGAWILAQNIAKNGVNWTSIGAYNAGFRDDKEPFRMRYARKVYARYLELTGN
ncbi:lytic transglycosylase domain-containing protein [Cronobacter sakazakii]|uniref:lytic transglycosylase domain-containing protein n=1 Tax=Cronobacter TaxID=413496 RepID=UPI000CFE30B3|nr:MULTISPECIES: lytic transglycosylase domain-containing protein [Cronobacter]EKM0439573.1 lytic transglycosylase domain-containing protein [Cronobacter turicensis]EKS1073443.1 lytic transglycosylase domain-containing protein [Cronobacter sakazakii]EKS1087121.1 lytic transglycosylase domain-containing protein [Cronobacter sakazakii]ELQ5973797.1 lytic transglycosylase domain-containing protein [Cronobacter sakazakii]ELQ6034817.1 lytic transglycosylase domain-containing protein [Cronobacter sak